MEDCKPTNDKGTTEVPWGDKMTEEAETSCACDGLEPGGEARVDADAGDTGTVKGEKRVDKVETGSMGSELAAADEEEGVTETND